MFFAPDPGRLLRPSSSAGLARLAPMVVTAVAAALALGPAAPAASATSTATAPTAYVLNETAGTMSAVDTATGTVTGTVNASAPDGVGSAPDAEAASPDGSRVYVVNDGDNSVSVIDTATGEVTARVPVGRNPLSAVVSPTGRTVAVSGGDNVYLLHVNSLRAARLPKVLRTAGVAFSPDGTELYVSAKGSLMVFDTATNALVDTLSAADGSYPVISPDGRTAYVLSGSAGVASVTVVDIATDTAVATIPVSEGSNGYDSLTLSPDGAELYADVVGTMNVISTAENTVTTGYPATGHVVFSPNDALAYEYADTPQDTGITAIDPATGAVLGTIPNAGAFLDAGFSPDGTRAYVESTTGVQVYDTATTSLIAAVPGSAGLSSFAFARGKAYLLNSYAGTVSVLDLATDAITATVNGEEIDPDTIALTPGGADAYVGGQNGSSVAEIDTATGDVVSTIDVGYQEPTAIAMSPDGTRAYVSTPLASDVSVIDTATNTVTSQIPVASNGSGSGALAVSPDGSTVYVADGGADNVSVIDTTTDTVTANIHANYTTGLTVSPDGTRLYALGPNGVVTVISTATDAIIGSITVSTTATATAAVLSPDGSTAYVALMSYTAPNEYTQSIAVVDTATDAVTGTITVGSGTSDVLGPVGKLAITPDGSELYLTTTAPGLPADVTVVNTATQAVSTIPVGSNPSDVAIAAGQ